MVRRFVEALRRKIPKEFMNRLVRYFVAGAVVASLAVGIYLATRTSDVLPASAASDTTTSTTTPVTLSGFYLAIGASSSLGFQPTGIVHHNGRRTPDGYANDLVLLESFQGIALTLRQMGCPGETVQTILNTKVADHCYSLPETQMTQSVSFLQSNQSSPGVVTVDLGFNNIRLCLWPAAVNEACVNQAIAAVHVDMPKVLRELKGAAGPRVRFVGLEYNDPFLARYFNGAAGYADASESLVAMNRLNATLAQVYLSAGVSVANVPALFDTEITTRVPSTGGGVIPENVAQACAMTWMCYGAPFGPDDHPNDAGYALIAQAIAAVLPKSW
jgi:lysophospholipase L1-like esterase